MIKFLSDLCIEDLLLIWHVCVSVGWKSKVKVQVQILLTVAPCEYEAEAKTLHCCSAGTCVKS
jgi:hypothetical protein